MTYTLFICYSQHIKRVDCSISSSGGGGGSSSSSSPLDTHDIFSNQVCNEKAIFPVEINLSSAEP